MPSYQDKYYSGLIPDFWTSYNQRRASGARGRELTGREYRRLLDPLLESDYNRQLGMGARALQQANLDREFAYKKEMEEKALAAQEDAARMQGAVNIAGLYGQYKVGMGLTEAYKARTAVDAAKAGLAPGATPGLPPTQFVGSYGPYQEAGQAAAGDLLTGGVVQGGAAGGGGLIEAGAAGGTAFVPNAAGVAGAPAATAAETAAFMGAEAPVSLGAAASGAALPALAAGTLVSQGLLGKESDFVQAVGGGIAGGIAGGIGAYVAIGASAGPLGAAIGFGIGVLSSFADDIGSVICTELYRQGLLDEKMYLASSKYCKEGLDKKIFKMYLRFAKPIVPKMRKSKLVTKIVKPFGIAMAQECAHRADPYVYKTSCLGRAIEVFLKSCVWVEERYVSWKTSR